MLRRLMDAAKRADRDPREISCVLNLEIRVDPAADAKDDAVCGSVEAVVDQLQQFVAMGFTGFNFIPVGYDASEQVQLIARDILPRLSLPAA